MPPLPPGGACCLAQLGGWRPELLVRKEVVGSKEPELQRPSLGAPVTEPSNARMRGERLPGLTEVSRWRAVSLTDSGRGKEVQAGASITQHLAPKRARVGVGVYRSSRDSRPGLEKYIVHESDLEPLPFHLIFS